MNTFEINKYWKDVYLIILVYFISIISNSLRDML